MRFTRGRRDVTLLSGEALFHVAKDPARRFGDPRALPQDARRRKIRVEDHQVGGCAWDEPLAGQSQRPGGIE